MAEARLQMKKKKSINKPDESNLVYKLDPNYVPSKVSKQKFSLIDDRKGSLRNECQTAVFDKNKSDNSPI